MNAEVVVAGGGPTGLMLANELVLRGISTVVVERLPEPSPHSRAWGLHARSAETLDRRGLLEPLIGGRDVAWPKVPFAGMWPLLDLSGLDSDHPYLVNVPQTALERLLEQRAREGGAQVRRGVAVTRVEPDADGVTVVLDGGDRLPARYVVGCDGARSAVRAAGRIGFPGTEPTVAAMLCDCRLPEMAGERRGITRTAAGTVNLNLRPGGAARVVVTEFGRTHADRDEPVSIDEFAAAVRRVLGRNVTMSEPAWMTRFSDATRLADRYVDGRLILAGDAAHIHFPYGGLGLNLGLQDAVNLGWKLAAVVRGADPAMLGTYADERRPVAAAVLAYSRAQLALFQPGDDVTELRDLFAGLLRHDSVNEDFAGFVTGTSTRYDLPGGHPLTGTFARDRKVPGSSLVELLRGGSGVLVDASGDYAATAAPWAGDVTVTSADSGPNLLVRPDGYVAWAADDGGQGGLREALDAWFGARS
jgi:2-polyprenyl-6-methoxyphenol hydroxylase-like FAD-dependent oxidoreductase